jgi:heptosyltransferase I
MFRDSRRPEKNWPGFDELTRALLARPGDLRVVWAGTQRHPLADWARAETRFADLCGQTRVDELPQLLAAADLVVANDSGPMHLAAAMGRPVLALFGPTDPAQFGPYPPGRPGNSVLVAPDGDLGRLAPDVVARAVEDALAARPAIT